MKLTPIFILAATIIVAGLATANLVQNSGTVVAAGAVPEWGSAVSVSTVGDTIVITDGSLIEARNLGSGTYSVNGVSFTSLSTTGDLDTAAVNSGLYGDGVIGTNFENVMDRMAYNSGGGSGDITIGSLTIGETYKLQLFCSDDRDAGKQARLQSYTILSETSAQVTNGSSYSIIVTFVATATSETLTINDHSSAAAQLQAYQTREQ